MPISNISNGDTGSTVRTNLNAAIDAVNALGNSSTLNVGTSANTIAAGNDSRFSAAAGLKTATNTVTVSAAAAPSSGQALIATSATTATWQAINVGLPVEYGVALGDETTAATVGTKLVWRIPCNMTVSYICFECTTAPTGSVAILDVKESGSTIFSTKPQIALSATTSFWGAVSGVLSDTTLNINAPLTFSIDQIGSTIAGAGYKATIVGVRL